ncbi:MAG: PAS/PAC sensor signal transduction histidine kinase, partial [Candidatus Collierbacteria bacterium GW2011_GWF2_44_15]
KLFRADNANDVDPSGTGLGLYIVYEIVKASGGTVRFDSEVKRGSTFYVSYPLKGMVRKIGEKSLS